MSKPVHTDHTQFMTTKGGYVVPHPIQRAQERYGIKLTLRDLMVLCEQCQMGYGRQKIFPDGKEQHIVMHGDKALIVIYRPPDKKTVFRKEGVILTILPREAMNATRKYLRENKKNMREKKRMPKKARKRQS